MTIENSVFSLFFYCFFYCLRLFNYSGSLKLISQKYAKTNIDQAKTNIFSKFYINFFTPASVHILKVYNSDAEHMRGMSRKTLQNNTEKKLVLEMQKRVFHRLDKTGKPSNRIMATDEEYEPAWRRGNWKDFK